MNVATKTELFAVRGNGRKPYRVASVEDAARQWIEFRDKTMQGVSAIGNGVRVVDAFGTLVAEVSYNGRVWLGGYKAAK